jgi:hypothetical protein
MNERLLLLLPHGQMVFTFPKVLRVFFRHDRKLRGEISKMVYLMIQRFHNEAAGRRIQSAAVIDSFLRRTLLNERLARNMLGHRVGIINA